MTKRSRAAALAAVALLAGITLAGCGGGAGDGGAPAPGITARTVKICPGPEAQAQALAALFDVREGETVEFCEGNFDFTTGLILHSKKGVTIQGAGRDKTFLTFRESGASEGLNVSHSDGITLQGLTVQDTPGNAIRVYRTRYVTMRDVRTRWRDYATDPSKPPLTENDAGYKPYPTNGAYGLYPVESRQILMEDCEAHGASDAGIYVGQSSDILVQRCLARFNVAGYEFENTYRAVFQDNVATNNTGGFLVFDLPGLSQYGEKNIVRRNQSYDNNTENFAPIGNIVGVVPRGTGMLILATDQLEVYENEIRDNDTVGLALVNFALAEPGQSDIKYDFFPEAIAIYDNLFRDNGGNPQQPNPDRGEASLLPALLVARNNGRGVHIIWDGAVDEPNGCEAFPKDSHGVPLNQPNAINDLNTGRYEERVDERGRPNYQRSDQLPECTGSVAERKYNQWKFDANGALVHDKNGLYIPDTGQPRDNVFESTKPETALVTKFLRANITSGDPEQLATDLITKQPETDLANYQAPLPFIGDYIREIESYVSDRNSDDARPTAAEVDAACNAQPAAGTINHAALAKYNCPLLHQYGMFSDPADPRRGAVGGVPFELNSALFSDYTTKYRFLFLPPGGKAQYRTGDTATLDFPVGTVIAKTFAFRREYDGADQPIPREEDVVETRLLIKRQTSGGGVNWVGLPYIWTTKDGQRVAELKVEGGTFEGHYRYDDPDPGVPDPNGAAPDYEGTVAAYAIPAALNCITCHGGDDREPGAAPLGLKVRYLNRAYDADGPQPGVNQLTYLKNQGLLEGLPADFSDDRHPRWNVPGSSGAAADSPQDIHQRVRAYLEVNCMHCHNSNGAASNSGLFLEASRTVNVTYGICKTPVAAGKGSGNRQYDIVPGEAGSAAAGESAGSILYYRISNTEAGVRMPPLARTVVHGQAANLIATWINDALPAVDEADEEAVQDEDICSGTGVPAP